MDSMPWRVTERVASRKAGCLGALPRWFMFSASMMLAITGVAQAWSAFGGTKLLAVGDPIVGKLFTNALSRAGIAIVAAVF
jgi:hypothetical protein